MLKHSSSDHIEGVRRLAAQQSFKEHDKAVWVPEWQGLEQHRSHDREHRRVRPDAYRHYKHYNQGESAIAQESPRALGQIARKLGKSCAYTALPILTGLLVGVKKLAMGLRRRFR